MRPGAPSRLTPLSVGLGVNKSTTDDAASSSNIQSEFSTAGIDNDKPTDMELDEVASEGTAGEESSSGCNSNDQTNQSKTMKERMAEIFRGADL